MLDGNCRRRSWIPWVLGAIGLLAGSTLWWVISDSPNDEQTLSGRVSQERPTVQRDAVAAEDSYHSPVGSVLHSEVLSVTDADRRGGVWFLLDQANRAVHRIGPDGEWLGQFGREGEGPGEFGVPEALAAHGDTLVVADWNVVHLYALNGDHLTDKAFAIRGCASPSPTVQDIVSVSSGILLLVRCSGLSGMESLVWLLANDGESQVLARDTSVSSHGYIADFNSIPVLSSHPRGFLFGNVRDTCLGLYGPDGLLLEQVCHEWIARPVPPPPLAQEYARVADDLRRDARRLAMSVRVVDLERLWPFTRVFVMGSGDPVYVSPVVSQDGVERARLRYRDEIGWNACAQALVASDLFVAEASALAVWNHHDGTRIAVCEAR